MSRYELRETLKPRIESWDVSTVNFVTRKCSESHKNASIMSEKTYETSSLAKVRSLSLI